LNVRVLEDQADLAAEIVGEGVVSEMLLDQFGPAEANLAGGGEDQPVQEAQKRRFSGAVGSQQSDAGSFGDRKAEIAKRGLLLIAIGDAIDFEEHQRPAQTAAAAIERTQVSAAQSRPVI
jgi:hypothetical protein